MEPVPLLDLQAQYATLREAIDRAISEVVASQAFILGPIVERLEQEVAAHVGARHAVGCASGTDALILSLAALDIGPGDEVLTSPFSFFSTASCAYKVGARPAFADIDPKTFNLDPDAARAAIGPRTRALLPVHLFGQCAAMDRLTTLADERGLPLIEDAAQALGASYRPEPAAAETAAGTMGTLGCYSFFPTKNLGAFGDGGMIVTSDDRLAERLRLLRVHGGQQMYHHRFVGWNSRLDALQAAVLRVKLPWLDRWCEAREANARYYDQRLSSSGVVTNGDVTLPHRDPACRHIFNQYTLRVARRDALRDQLRERGVGHAVYYPVPLHRQECFAELEIPRGAFPEAERACDEVISLPIYAEMGAERLEHVAAAVAEFYGKR